MNSKKLNKKSHKLVSVVIVNWNGKKWLKKCLDSINKQTYKNIETIIVDNASADGSVEYIKNNYPKVKLILNNQNLGYSRAVNIGINKSKGTYLLLLNNDVWVEKKFVEKLYEFYKNENYCVISPIVKGYTGKKTKINLPNIDPTGSPAYFYPLSRKDKVFYLSSCYFCSKDNYIKTLGFDNDYFAYYEDVDWFWRIALLGKSISYADQIYVYHEGAGSIGKGIKYKMFLWRNQNALQTILKNYSAATLIFILPLYVIQNLFEIIFCLVILRPQLAYSYIQGWWFNVKNYKKIKKKRDWIQKRRVINDLEILKRMYLGPAKLMMLINYSK